MNRNLIIILFLVFSLNAKSQTNLYGTYQLTESGSIQKHNTKLTLACDKTFFYKDFSTNDSLKGSWLERNNELVLAIDQEDAKSDTTQWHKAFT